ncbi:MAG: methyltransferase domain-containing protein [Acidobacteriota bacterium]|nr:methyltransferase domain-containing protein [Acidobacteriota bacterium]
MRVPLFLTIVLTVIGGAAVLLQGIAALLQLGPVERERDSWQKPSEILQALDLHQGATVVDLGCGSGYFTLKLSPLLGNQGRVLAVDIRREPLIFLWIRSLVLPAHNVSIIHGQTTDATLGTVRLDAALISNTYHELTSAPAILEQLHRSLRRSGRLVVVDRGPELSSESRQVEMQHHEVPLHLAEREIVQAGFQILSGQDRFIYSSTDSPWWLIVAVKP